MLKLSRIEMIGFKSFCDKAEIVFPEEAGVTAIVGPNGCGKSNIADAIAWVLGEQSVKSLRGSSMEDVIFNGTRDRLPLGLAQVSLTLLDPEFKREAEIPAPEMKQENIFEGEPATAEATALPEPPPTGKPRSRRKPDIKPGEILVTRKLYRSGESEYYMNGRQCRLRDIQELFMGTGLGPNSYAIIEQGRVGQILSSKPYDRRMLIEEAAGTTKYKAKRKLAEAKLESAKLNLSRVNDIIEEVTRQLNSLKRQASKARRYQELREELRDKTTAILYSKLIGLEESIAQTRSDLKAAAEQAEATQSELRLFEADQVSTQQRSFELEDLLRRRHETLSQTHLELDRAQNRVVYSHQQLGALEQRLQEMEGEFASLVEQEAGLESEIALKRAEDDGLLQELRVVEGEASEIAARAGAGHEQIRALEEGLDRNRNQLLETVQRAATLSNQIAQIDEADVRMTAQRERLQGESGEAQRQGEQYRQLREEIALAVEEEKRELEKVISELAAQTSALETARNHAAELQAAHDEMKRQQADAEARQRSVEEIVNHHAYVDEGVKQLLTSDLGAAYLSFRPLGVLADFIEVESEFEPAVEEFLKDELEFLLVESSEAAREGIEILRTRSSGRSTFVLPRDLSSPSHAPSADPEILAQAGVLAPVATLVRLQGRYAAQMHHLLPMLAQAFLVDSFATADRLAVKFPNAIFITREGEVFRGCWIRGGRKSAVGPLSLKRELRALESKREEFRATLAQSELERNELQTRMSELESVFHTLTERKIELEKSRVGSDHRLQQIEGDLVRTEQNQNVIQGELARLDLERQQARDAQSASRRELGELEAAKQTIDATLLHHADEIRDVKAHMEALNAEISERKAKLATLTERKQSSQQALDRLTQHHAELRQRRDRLTQQQEGARAQQESLRQSLVEVQEEIQRFSATKTELEVAIADSTHEVETLRGSLVELEERLKSQRDLLSQQMEARSAIEVTVARQESELAHVQQACLQELDRSWEELKLLQTTRLEGNVLEQIEQEHAQLRQKIDAMGAINMMALEEYAECEQRFTFLSTQRKDLLDSIADTTQTIEEIDLVSRQQFQEAFNAINEYFQETFKQLFGGGYGAMRLTDENDLQQSGIDLHAQPPGKKLQNVLLLSGGEKALTAIALLLAIFRYQPSPFCVLDEVDAPLDEANVERFSRIIAQLAGDTHFIVITHNKKTMEVARSMYGVTMQEAGVSKLVSVKFD